MNTDEDFEVRTTQSSRRLIGGDEAGWPDGVYRSLLPEGSSRLYSTSA
jgi:hypothetical protein